MKSRTWPLLAVAFGTLLALMAISGIGVLRRVNHIQDEILSRNERYRRTAELLSELRAEVFSSSTLIRDYLLDPSHLTVESYQRELRQASDRVGGLLARLEQLTDPAARPLFLELRAQLEAYWKSMQPLFVWTPQQKLALSSMFLRNQVLPRRDRVLHMAQYIVEWNAGNLKRHQEDIGRRRDELQDFLIRTTGITFGLGLGVALGSIVRILILERRAAGHRARVERAEAELRELSQKLVQAQEEERKRLSRELHDEVGQALTGLRMELANLVAARDQDGAVFEERVSELKRQVEQLLRSVRSMSMGLRPAMLDDLGLSPALEWQAREFTRRSGTPVELRIDGTVELLPEPHRVCIFRVTQEALTNCARHSSASQIQIGLHGGADAVLLTIQDNGRGFDSSDTARRGLGLLGLEERVRELGGRLDIFTLPERGTTLRIEIPLAKEARS